jgi:hypothetical protein
MTKRPIKELTQKLEFLATHPAVQEITGCSSYDALARAAGINKSTFKTLRGADNQDRISPDQESSIAKVCCFRLDWPEWVNGLASDFERRYLSEAEKIKKAKSEPRRTDIPLTPRYGDQKVAGRHASLRIETVLSNSSEQWPIRIELYCRSVDGYGLCRGFIDLDCGEAVAPRQEANFHQAFQVPDTNATLRLGAGTENRPSWSVEASNGILDDVCPAQHYCIVRELAPGDTLKATFSIYVKDVPANGDYLCRKDGKPLSRSNRKLILDRIAAIALLNSEAGEAVLCSHEVTFEDAYAGQREDAGAKGGPGA